MIVVRSRKRSLASAYAAGAPTIREISVVPPAMIRLFLNESRNSGSLKTVWKCESVREWGISRGGSVSRSAVLARLYRKTSKIGMKTDRSMTMTTR